MRFVLLGPPGAGKGTQAKRLAQEFKLPHLSTGEMFRRATAEGTPTGLQAKQFMDRGDLVPDRVVDQLVAECLEQPGAAAGFVLDGYPRTLSQAHALARLLTRLGRPLSAVLCLEVAVDVLIERLRARGEGRADDRPEVVRERLRVYRENTEPLVRHYGAQGCLHRIDGAPSVEEVWRAVREIVAGLAA